MRRKIKNKKIMIILLVLIMVFTICLCFYMKKDFSKNKINIEKNDITQKKTEKIMEERKDEENDKNIEDEGEQSIVVEEHTTIDNTPKNEENKSTSSSNYENNSNNNVKQDNNQSNKVEQKTTIDTTPVQEEKEKIEWEELGISEYEYYNTPMWSWARVDFKIKDYGSYEQAHQKCIDKGEENKSQGIGTSYSCNPINSYSGDLLGDMFVVR